MLLQAIKQTAAKHGTVNCIRYRAIVQLANDSDAEDFAKEVTQLELVRIEERQFAELEQPERVEVATTKVLEDHMRCKPYREGAEHGVEFHRYYVGAQLSIDEHGTLDLPTADPEDPIRYKYQIMPLAQLFGRRIASIWGLDGKPSNWADREDTATRARIRTLIETHEGPMPKGATSLPMVEIRSIKVGELPDGSNVHGYMILGCSDAISFRINAIAEQLKDIDMELVTMDSYRERAIAAKEAGNQVLDTAESASLGRKVMFWEVPRTLTAEMLQKVGAEYFGDDYESSDVTISRACHPYAWIVFSRLVESDDNFRIKVADFEAVAQSLWSPTICMAMSKTRQQRIRMKAAQRDRLDQRDAMQGGQLKEILVDPKLIQGALMEEAFMDIWIDALYTKIAPRLIEDLAAALDQKVQAMVEERLQLELGKRLVSFEKDVIARVLATIDSAVDFSLERAIEARSIELLGGQVGPELDVSDFDSFHDSLERADADVSALEKTMEVEPTEEVAGDASAQQQGAQHMATDSAAAKRSRDDRLEEIAKAATAQAMDGPGGIHKALADQTNTKERLNDAEEENQPPAKAKFRETGTKTSTQTDIRTWNAGRK